MKKLVVISCALMSIFSMMSAVSPVIAENSETEYTIDDVRNLQDFLLTKPTEDLSGKNYDLDGDNVWTVFDLCLMKREIIPPDDEQENTLVVYFSRTGNTEKIAEKIVDITGADVFEIEAKIPYTDEDIAYNNSSCRANQEQNDKNCRPEIAQSVDDFDSYDIVYLGYPIWWGEEPRIIDTFLESYDFSDKTVIPFCTSGSSGIGTSERNISELAEIGTQLEGRRFSANADSETVQEWVSSLFVEVNQEE